MTEALLREKGTGDKVCVVSVHSVNSYWVISTYHLTDECCLLLNLGAICFNCDIVLCTVGGWVTE